MIMQRWMTLGRQAKLVALEEETEAIHFANMLYWNCKTHSHEAVEY